MTCSDCRQPMVVGVVCVDDEGKPYARYCRRCIRPAPVVSDVERARARRKARAS